jgi:septal ring factor EnvC (AmiA/AmiB activator)
LTQKLAEREKEMQQLREASIKHEATVQTLNNQIRSLQQQLLDSERKVLFLEHAGMLETLGPALTLFSLGSAWCAQPT